jgi:FAD/FMN-containing dehydrogenase
MAVPPEVRALRQVIKQALDPHSILNPGKFL